MQQGNRLQGRVKDAMDDVLDEMDRNRYFAREIPGFRPRDEIVHTVREVSAHTSADSELSVMGW